MPKLHFDPYLNQTNNEFLQPMARVWSGKGHYRKHDCVMAIIKGLKDPQTIQRVVNQLKPFEKLALELALEAQGKIDAETLLMKLRLLDAEDLPDFHKSPERDHIAFIKYLIERGIFLCDQPLNSYSYSYTYVPLTIFSDDRILAYIGSPSFPQLPLKSATAPRVTSVRSPANVVLNILGMLQAIIQQKGFKRTQKGTFQVNSLKKFIKSQNWQEKQIDVDGFLFPKPAEAFGEALLHSGLLIPDEDSNVNLSMSIDEFVLSSSKEQIEFLLNGFLKTSEWSELDDNRYYNRELYKEARQMLVLVLKILPQSGRDWVEFNDFEQLLFNRLGEYFSLSSKPQYPKYFGNEDETTAVEKWRTKLRQDWLKLERVWIKYALSTWLYYLGIVELGLQPNPSSVINDTIVSFRLTDLGRSLLYSEYAENNQVTENTIKPAWIVQPNFEVMVYLEDAKPMQLALLERHCERLNVQQHIAQYRLTKDSVYNGWENGSSLAEFLAALREGSKVSLPQNVEAELQQWGNQREQVTLRRQVKLLEFPDEAARELALKKEIKGKPIGDKFILVAELETAKPWIGNSIDYNQLLPRCLSITEDGIVTLKQSMPDLLIHSQLNRWIEVRTDGSWQLTRGSVTKAIKAGAKIEELIELLRSRLTQAIPQLLSVALQAWGGYAPTVEIEKVLVLRCTNQTVFDAITSSPRFTPYLLGKLAPDVLLVDERQYKKLESELEWVGLHVSETLQNVPKLK